MVATCWGCFFTSSSSDDVVLLIDEVAQVAEEFLGPYIVEEHAKRENTVCGSRVNRLCSGHGLRLPEREDPDEERTKKKHPRPVDDESLKPILVVPLRAVAPGALAPSSGVGCPAWWYFCHEEEARWREQRI